MFIAVGARIYWVLAHSHDSGDLDKGSSSSDKSMTNKRCALSSVTVGSDFPSVTVMLPDVNHVHMLSTLLMITICAFTVHRFWASVGSSLTAATQSMALLVARAPGGIRLGPLIGAGSFGCVPFVCAVLSLHFCNRSCPVGFPRCRPRHGTTAAPPFIARCDLLVAA